MFHFTGSYTDKYQLSMAQVYFLKKQNHTAIFDYFFRKLPFGSAYAIFSGLADVLELLENYHFDEEDIRFLQNRGMNPNFIDYLKNFRFQGTIYSAFEGDLVFPNCPIVTVEANIIEAQLIETILLNLLNFQTLIATKACRIRHVAGDCALIDFGLRRAQGPGGYYASRAAIVGGFDSTSNVAAGRDYHIPITGTMSHSFIQSYDSEFAAFRDFAEIWPNHCTLLVDTYNTLESGVPNAIKIGKMMEQQGHRLQSIRLDSGDLGELAKKSRHMLNQAGLHYVTIVASNQLDEYRIKTLREQKAPIDAFGVGTNLVTGYPDAALDGVYKLAFAHDKPRIKLSETVSKITLPYKKQVYRLLQNDTFLGVDAIALMEENQLNSIYAPFEARKKLPLEHYQPEPILHKIMEHGKRLYPTKTLQDIAAFRATRMSQLPEEFKQLSNPKMYQVGLSNELKIRCDQLIKEFKK